MKASSMQTRNPISFVPVFAPSFMVAGSFSEEFPFYSHYGYAVAKLNLPANMQINTQTTKTAVGTIIIIIQVNTEWRGIREHGRLFFFQNFFLIQTITGPDQAEFVFSKIGGSGVLFILPV